MKKNIGLILKTALIFLFAFHLSCSPASVSGNRFGVPLLTNWTKESGIRVPGGVSPACIRLANGNWRIFYPSIGGIGSSISQDGLTFTPEEGLRVSPGEPGSFDANGAKDPDIISENGFWRMYYTALGSDNKHRVMSATSTDGLTWTKDAGVRIDYQASYDQLADVQTVVKVSSNDYKMYFVYDWFGDNSIKGATSTDGLNWTVQTLIGFLNDCMDPEVVLGSGGSLIMFFAAARTSSGPEPMDIYKATSSNGVNWTVVGSAIQPTKAEEGQLVGDPEIVQLANGTFRMYYYGMTGPESSNILSATASEL